ncbi:MAG: hypothetical protein MZV63_60310 [Marinilabiliales bacterium]|nr:hypothetical protein [Marinilabiliales bacterium]
MPGKSIESRVPSPKFHSHPTIYPCRVVDWSVKQHGIAGAVGGAVELNRAVGLQSTCASMLVSSEQPSAGGDRHCHRVISAVRIGMRRICHRRGLSVPESSTGAIRSRPDPIGR